MMIRTPLNRCTIVQRQHYLAWAGAVLIDSRNNVVLSAALVFVPNVLNYETLWLNTSQGSRLLDFL